MCLTLIVSLRYQSHTYMRAYVYVCIYAYRTHTRRFLSASFSLSSKNITSLRVSKNIHKQVNGWSIKSSFAKEVTVT